MTKERDKKVKKNLWNDESGKKNNSQLKSKLTMSRARLLTTDKHLREEKEGGKKALPTHTINKLQW